MKIRTLIELLQKQNPESNIKIMTQENYPIEHGILGLTSEDDMNENDGEPERESDPSNVGEQPPCDVFIVESGYIGYGPRAAWITYK